MLSALLAPALKYITGGLLFLTLMLGIAWQIELRHARKSDQRIVELTAKLVEISTRKNEQKIVTRDRIIIAERKGGDADRVAKKIEAAPLPGQCATPKEILSADI